MKFITEIQKQKLLHNGSFEQKDQDHAPVVKLFLPNTNATWLLSELEPENEHIAFGLCDLGMGFPELGFVDLEELDALRGKYQSFTQADLSKLRKAGYEAPFASVEEGVAQYVQWLNNRV